MIFVKSINLWADGPRFTNLFQSYNRLGILSGHVILLLQTPLMAICSILWLCNHVFNDYFAKILHLILVLAKQRPQWTICFFYDHSISLMTVTKMIVKLCWSHEHPVLLPLCLMTVLTDSITVVHQGQSVLRVIQVYRRLHLEHVSTVEYNAWFDLVHMFLIADCCFLHWTCMWQNYTWTLISTVCL